MFRSILSFNEGSHPTPQSMSKIGCGQNDEILSASAAPCAETRFRAERRFGELMAAQREIVGLANGRDAMPLRLGEPEIRIPLVGHRP